MDIVDARRNLNHIAISDLKTIHIPTNVPGPSLLVARPKLPMMNESVHHKRDNPCRSRNLHRSTMHPPSSSKTLGVKHHRHYRELLRQDSSPLLAHGKRSRNNVSSR